MSKSKDLMKRQRILQAAGRVFSTKGFASAKISEIAREADVADGTIYLYFRDKNDLLNAVFENHVETLLTTTQKELRGAADALAKLHVFVESHLKFFGEQPDLGRVFQSEIQQNVVPDATTSKPKLQEYLKVLLDLVQEGQTSSLIRQDLDASLLQRLLFGAMADLALNLLPATGKAVSWRDAAEQVYQFFLAGLTASPKISPARLSAA